MRIIVQRKLLLGVTAFVAVTAATLPPSVPPQAAASATPVLQDGARSKGELIDRLLDALKKNDADALRRLKLTEAEYSDILLPGHVAPGKPPRQLPATWKEYSWADISNRSYYYELLLLKEFGGHDLAVKEINFDRGEKEYAGYKAYVETDLTLVERDGTQRTLQTGSIAEIGGRFKFISFNRD